MPLYEYGCTSCGALTDIRHGFDETTSERCVACGGTLARRFSATGIVFKGPGFYVTDSRAKSSGGATKPAPAADAPAAPSGTASAPAPSTPSVAAGSAAPAPGTPTPAPGSSTPAA